MRTLRLRALLSGRYGIAAISDPKFFTENATYILSGLNTWGWVTLIYGRWCARIIVIRRLATSGSAKTA